ncbi:hypothetical protein EMCRGX_G007832 [Ephydatia muelleri]
MTCFEGLSSTTLSQLQSVARLAYQGTLQDQLIFHDVQDNIESLGLLQKVPQLYSTSSPQASYNFIHKTLQEFLTAWYVSSRPTSEQRVFVKDSLTKPNMAMTVRFMAGLTKFQTSSENMADIAISLETTDEQRLVENLHWMFETQNPTFIQRLMGNKEQTLNLSLAHLNPFDLYALVYCIVNSSTLWSVDLGFCDLTDECMRMLFLVEDGKAFDHITSLDLTGNRGFMTTSTSLLGMMLKENNTLKKLDLYGCELQPEGLEQVMKGVQANTKLEKLSLSRNIIDNKRASCLSMMLKGNTTLKELDLRECGLEPEGLEEVMKGVEVNTKLETLYLSGNIIDNKRASCLGMMLKGNTTLKRLDLRECGLEPEGLEEVMKGVEVNTKLEKLSLSGNIIDNKRASCLGMMLKENTTLKRLDLMECGLEPEGLEEVMKGVEVNTKLETLGLSKNIIDNKRASCLELGASTVLRINLSTCDHGNADVLSRLPVGPDISFDEGEDVADVDTVCTIKTVSLQLDPTDPGTMAKESAKDPGSRVIIPSILRPQVLQLLHLGHFGIQRMKQLARTAVYWPRIDADIMDLFHQCTASAEHQNKPPKLANHPWMLPEKPWSRVHVDHAIIFLGCNWLVLIDAYSKYPSIHPTTSTSTKSTTELLEQDLLICAYCTGKQAQAATKSQECELPNKVAVTYNVGSPCYALYYGPRGEKDPRWVLAVVTKRFGTCSVNVRVFPRGGTWRRHVEQLRPRYVDQEDTDPGPVQIQTMEPVVSLQEATLLADGAPTPAMAQMPVLVPPPVGKAQNPRLPTGNEYSTHNPRRSSRRPISRKPEVCA